jgi:hypothetical protein
MTDTNFFHSSVKWGLPFKKIDDDVIAQKPMTSFKQVVLWRTINLGRQISDISKKSMQATIYCHYD